MDSSAIGSGKSKMQKTNNDDAFVRKMETSGILSVKHSNKSNSVVDLGRVGKNSVFDSVTSENNFTPIQRVRSKSCSTSDYYTAQKYSSDLDLTTKSEKDRVIKFVRSESVHPTSIRDAHPTLQPSDSEENDGAAKQPVMFMPVSKHAECYNMNHKNRGKCVIFNHESFETNDVEKREGTEQDVKRLQNSFTKLGFDVEAYKDFSHAKVMDKIMKLSKFDHTDNDCLCVIVLSHGSQKDLIWATDAAYKLDNIWKPFTADKCKTLAGKPKLFFIQACRGDELDGGVVLAARSMIQAKTDSNLASYKIPTHADFLIAHSTVSGFCSWRDPTEGTWYIQCLCDVLDEHGMEMDLLNMLTITTRKVAMDYTSHNDMNAIMNNQKQVPSVTTMLLRSLYFLPKSDK